MSEKEWAELEQDARDAARRLSAILRPFPEVEVFAVGHKVGAKVGQQQQRIDPMGVLLATERSLFDLAHRVLRDFERAGASIPSLKKLTGEAARDGQPLPSQPRAPLADGDKSRDDLTPIT